MKRIERSLRIVSALAALLATLSAATATAKTEAELMRDLAGTWFDGIGYVSMVPDSQKVLIVYQNGGEIAGTLDSVDLDTRQVRLRIAQRNGPDGLIVITELPGDKAVSWRLEAGSSSRALLTFIRPFEVWERSPIELVGVGAPIAGNPQDDTPEAAAGRLKEAKQRRVAMQNEQMRANDRRYQEFEEKIKSGTIGRLVDPSCINVRYPNVVTHLPDGMGRYLATVNYDPSGSVTSVEVEVQFQRRSFSEKDPFVKAIKRELPACSFSKTVNGGQLGVPLVFYPNAQ